MRDWDKKELNQRYNSRSIAENEKFKLEKVYKPRIIGFSIGSIISFILLGISIRVYYFFELDFIYTTFIIISGTFSLFSLLPLLYYLVKSHNIKNNR